MDQKTEQLESRLDKIAPPAESHVSTVLNGVGNGMMIGGGGTLLYNLYHEVRGSTPSPNRAKYGIAFTVVGCALGAWYGMREAESVKSYRQEVSNEVSKLRAEVNANSAAMKDWTERMSKHEAEQKLLATR